MMIPNCATCKYFGDNCGNHKGSESETFKDDVPECNGCPPYRINKDCPVHHPPKSTPQSLPVGWEERLQDFYFQHEKPQVVGLDLEDIKSFIRSELQDQLKETVKKVEIVCEVLSEANGGYIRYKSEGTNALRNFLESLSKDSQDKVTG